MAYDPSHPTKYDNREAMLERLRSFDRDDFRGELARALSIAPGRKALRRFANKAPDRWGQLVAILSRLSGFNEQIEVKVKGSLLTYAADLEQRSDGELDAMLAALRAPAPAKVIALPATNQACVARSPDTPDPKPSSTV